jgi:hypothetical protein
MDRGRVGEDRGSKETDGCPLTTTTSSTTSLASSGLPNIKTEDLSAFFDHFAQMLTKPLTLPGSKSKSPQSSPSSSSSSGVSQTSTIENLHCIFCSLQGHFISDCLVCQSYIMDGRCGKDSDGKIVLPNGQFTPRSIPG